MVKKYRALRAIAFVFQVLAWVSLVLTILGAIGAVGAGVLNWISIPALDELRGMNSGFAAAGVVAGIVSAMVIFIAGILNFIVLLAAGEFIYVQIDIESNTRQTAEYLRQALVAPPVTPLNDSEPYAPAPTITIQSTPAAQ